MNVIVVFACLTLARVSSFVAVLPLLGGIAVPRTVKLGFAVALSVFWGTTYADQMSNCAGLAAGGTSMWLLLVLAVGREALLGLLIGFVFGLFMIPAHIAGEFLSQEMGLSFGNMISPTGNSGATPISVIFEMLAGAVFLGLDGHHLFFRAMDSVFEHVPLGGAALKLPLEGLLSRVSAVQEWGLIVAAPMALCLFLTTIVLSLLAKATPSLNLYSVAFPLRIGVGLVTLLLLLPQVIVTLVSLFGHMEEFLTGIW